MKTIEFFNLPSGAIFDFEWRSRRGTTAPELNYSYSLNVTIEYIEHGCKQSFWNKLLYGKLPSVTPVKHYGNGYSWRTYEDLKFSQLKGFSIEFSSEGTEEQATIKVLDSLRNIIETCPTNNVIIFGYDLKIVDGMIVPNKIPLGPEYKDQYFVFIDCGFVAY